MASAFFQLARPEAGKTWDWIGFGADVTTHEHKFANRTLSSTIVTVNGAVATNATTITLDNASGVTANSILYDPARGQAFVIASVNLTTNVVTIRQRQVDHGVTTAIVPDNTELLVGSESSFYDDVSGERLFESTVVDTNFVQDLTYILEFSRADLEESREWDVTRQRRLVEDAEKTVRMLNRTAIYGKPQGETASLSATAGGIDYFVKKAGNVSTTAHATTRSIADLQAVFQKLEKKGLSGADAPVILCGVDEYHRYNAVGLTAVTLNETNGTSYASGNILLGINVPAFGFVPMISDPEIRDADVRILTNSSIKKHYFNGNGELGQRAVLRVEDEAQLSSSKVKKSSVQMKYTFTVDGDKNEILKRA